MKSFKFLNFIIFSLSLLSIISCDKDYNTIGSDLIGNESFTIAGEPFSVKAYNQKINSVQTNNQEFMQFGISNSSIFGKTIASSVVQLDLDATAVNRVFPLVSSTTKIVIDSVVVSIPFLSIKTSTDASGRNNYNIQNIISDDPNPNVLSPIAIKAYENGYFLRDLDPATGLTSTQKYYSGQSSLFNSNKLQLLADVSVTPSAKEIVKFKNTVTQVPDPNRPGGTMSQFTPNAEVDTRSAPKLQFKLDNDLIRSRIINASADKFANSTAFKNYFKGIYFQVQNTATGSLINLDFRLGDVTVYYTEDEPEANIANGINERIQKTFKMNMLGNSVNLFDNVNSTTFENAITTANATLGDSRLYLKGGQGSMAFVELFSNNTELTNMRALKPIINNAQLTFTIDSDFVTNNNKPEPFRVYLYNADKNIPIIDYFDVTTVPTNEKANKYIFGGIIQTDSNNKGLRYSINITDHINGIINNNNENCRLALVVTNNINRVESIMLESKINLVNPSAEFDKIPKYSIIEPSGTVLYGSNVSSADEAKKIKFQIHYTKTN